MNPDKLWCHDPAIAGAAVNSYISLTRIGGDESEPTRDELVVYLREVADRIATLDDGEYDEVLTLIHESEEQPDPADAGEPDGGGGPNEDDGFIF